MYIKTDHDALLSALDQNGIAYGLRAHEEVHTISDCYRVQTIPENGVMPKNVFLCNRQQTQFYLYVCAPFSPFRTAVFSKALGVSRLSFAPEDKLAEYLHVSPGAVTPLALLFDGEKRVKLVLDETLLKYAIWFFHPLNACESLSMDRDAFLSAFLPLCGHEPAFVRLPAEESAPSS